MVNFSGLGRGFVRSGSGYVSTPATRAAARAAGTFGDEGYAGAAATATKLLSVLEQASRDYNAAIGKRSSEARATVAASWAIMEQEKAKARIAAAAAAAAAAATPCPEGNEYKPIYPDMTCPIGYWEDIRGDGLWCVCSMWKNKIRAAPTTPTPPTPPAEKPWYYYLTDEYLLGVLGITREEAAKTEASPTPPTPPAECPKGLFYDAKWYLQCATGYIEYSLKGHNKCICSARMAEAKAQLDSLYAKEEVNGDGDGVFAGFKDLGKISNYIPVLIIGAIIIAVIGMFKK